MKLNDIDLNKLRVFHAVVAGGSYRVASADLGLTRSAISQSITALESQLGVSLFLRKSKRLIPTESARTLFDEFDQYQNSLSRTIERLRRRDSEVEGLVRIGSYLEFGKARLMPVLSHFFNRHPEVEIKLQIESPSELQNLLESDRVDLIFSIFPVKGVKSIDSIKLFQEELVLVGPTQMVQSVVGLEDLLRLPIIDYYPKHQLIKRWIYRHFAKRPAKLPIRMYAATAEMVMEAVINGSGVGVVPNYIFESCRDLSKVKVIRPSRAQLIDYIWLSQFKGQFKNSAHKALYGFVRDRF